MAGWINTPQQNYQCVTFKWSKPSSFPTVVFEYHGFSGDGPINLFIEENLLQHRAPRPRARSTPSHGSEKSSQLAKSKETSQSQNDAVGDSDTEPVRSDTRRVTAGPTVTSPKAHAAGQGANERPMHVMDEPKETSEATANGGQTTDSPRATPAPELKVQMPITAKSAAAGSSTRAPSPPTEGATLTAAVATYSAHVHSTAASTTSTLDPAATAMPVGEMKSTQRPTTTPVTAPQTTSAPSTSSTTATSTRRLLQAKRKYKISWDEADVEDRQLELDEPMRPEKGFSRPPGKYL